MQYGCSLMVWHLLSLQWRHISIEVSHFNGHSTACPKLNQDNNKDTVQALRYWPFAESHQPTNDRCGDRCGFPAQRVINVESVSCHDLIISVMKGYLLQSCWLPVAFNVSELKCCQLYDVSEVVELVICLHLSLQSRYCSRWEHFSVSLIINVIAINFLVTIHVRYHITMTS